VETLQLSGASIQTAGILLLAVVAVEFGGTYLLRIVRGKETVTPFQVSFSRAGHAHAGVLVILSLVVQPFVDASGLAGIWETAARSGIPVAAVLMSAGFFLSSAGTGRTAPSRLILVLYVGIASLTLGVVSLGVGLLTA
jgi:hypothetical protein